ncbi:sodium/proline symporter [Synergistaceae bacterium OttesenSCG-928-I11]|nr:sodium/proline symporter [Synergistaceae bacterium OttesenSCG-928-I11]
MYTNALYIGVFVAYFAVFIGIGIYQGRKVKSEEDYAIAGRDLPGWAAALSERATGESSWALIGLPGWAYAVGVNCIWVLIGCLVGIFVAWFFLAERLRNAAAKYDAVSFVDLIAKMHPGMGKPIRVASSSLILFFFFFYVGAQFLGGGKVFETMFGISPQIGMLLTTLIIIPYTVYGGFQSVVYTDCVQGVLMIVALVIAPLIGVFVLKDMTGVYANGIIEALTMAGPSYTSLTGGAVGFAAVLVVLDGFSWFFGYLGGTPQLSMRFMAIKDTDNVKFGRNLGIIWTVVAYAGTLIIGYLGIALWGPTGLTDPESVFPRVMMEFFHPAVAALFIVAAFAALISTADSLLVLASNEFSENIFMPYFSKKGTNNLFVSRLSTALIAVVALGSTFVLPSNLIYNIIGYVWAGIGCPFSVVVLLSFFWDKFSSKAALATIIGGMVFTIFWVTSGLDGEIFTSRAVSFFVSLLIGVVVSYMAPRTEEEVLQVA